MVTNERIQELFARAAIGRGAWVGLSASKDCDGRDGRIVTVGSSREEVQEAVIRMRGYKNPGTSDPVLVGDVMTVQNV